MSFINPKIVEKVTEQMVKEGLITQDQLLVAQVSHQDLGEDLANVLIQKGFLSEPQLLGFLGKYLSIPYISLSQYPVEAELAKECPVHLARQYHLVPLRRETNEVVVAMSDPLDMAAIEEVRNALGAEVRPVLASSVEIQNLMDRLYGTKRPPISEISFETITGISSEEDYGGVQKGKRLEEIATGPRVVQTVNEMMVRAYQESASDIHIEPRLNEIRVRFRIDGVLEEGERYSQEMHLPIVSRIKIMAGLDIAERRVPQDGRIRIRIGGKPVDLRVSTYPTLHGEKVVLRLLSMARPLSIEHIGFGKKEKELFKELIALSHGIFLVTGPTGSGKSTTLYAALERLNTPEKNIVSIEDPVEREIVGISQAQINTRAGVIFASALRAILRQDPDIIMLGEIRDRETAEIAVRAAITGHLVLSTLHTNTTAGAISRLIDLGVEPFLLSAALVGVLAQRLVRCICPECREACRPGEASSFKLIEGKIKKMFRGKGCSECRMTGYSGRLGIFELAPIRANVRELITQNASDKEIAEEFLRMKVKSLLEDGLEKVEAGLTTLDEVLRVTQED